MSIQTELNSQEHSGIMHEKYIYMDNNLYEELAERTVQDENIIFFWKVQNEKLNRMRPL